MWRDQSISAQQQAHAQALLSRDEQVGPAIYSLVLTFLFVQIIWSFQPRPLEGELKRCCVLWGMAMLYVLVFGCLLLPWATAAALFLATAALAVYYITFRYLLQPALVVTDRGMYRLSRRPKWMRRFWRLFSLCRKKQATIVSFLDVFPLRVLRTSASNGIFALQSTADTWGFHVPHSLLIERLFTDSTNTAWVAHNVSQHRSRDASDEKEEKDTQDPAYGASA